MPSPRVLSIRDRRRLGQTLSRLADADVAEAIAFWEQHAGQRTPAAPAARRIGLTGPPGVGKSTLLGPLAVRRRRAGNGVGVLAIDPSSPRAGGAILGDRVRMDEVAGIDEVFIRSVASRAALDGLAQNTPELLAAMDSAGFDEVLLETVGVGQVQYAVRDLVDTVVLVLAPGSGDIVQAAKAGYLELADLLVVSKADRPEAVRLADDLAVVLHAGSGRGGPMPPIVKVSQHEPASIDALSAAIDAHQAGLAAGGGTLQRQQRRAAYRLLSLLERLVAERCSDADERLLALPLRDQLRAIVQSLERDARCLPGSAPGIPGPRTGG
ncbi:MAG: ArgK/MeaB family GTPase [Lautropia sp.]